MFRSVLLKIEIVVKKVNTNIENRELPIVLKMYK